LVIEADLVLDGLIYEAVSQWGRGVEFVHFDAFIQSLLGSVSGQCNDNHVVRILSVTSLEILKTSGSESEVGYFIGVHGGKVSSLLFVGGKDEGLVIDGR
jgi:hypothetical protein